jgi:DNA-binding MarR family transcriptional regulator
MLGHLMRRLSVVELGVTQTAVVGRLGERSPQGIGELAAAEGVRMPTMTEVVSRLEAQGWVARSQAVRDHRRVEVRITEPGRGLIRAAGQRRSNYLQGLLAGLTTEELLALEAALPALDHLLNEAGE